MLHLDVNKERDMYEKLVAGCDPRVQLFAQVTGSGSHNRFHCIVFELCHCTLFDVLTGFSGLLPLPAWHILEIGYQMVSGTEYLHSQGIIHTDIKPDNIALKFGDTVSVRWLDTLTGYHDKRILVSTQICIIDLGNAIEVEPSVGNYGRVGARAYRAPEVVLGLPWSYGVDAFNIGCVMAELYLQENLLKLDIEGDIEYLAAIDALVGPFPEDYALMVNARFPNIFTLTGRVTVKFPADGTDPHDPEACEALRRLASIRPVSARVHNATLCDLIRRLMFPDSAERIDLEGAAKHKYFDALRLLQLQ
ncbi:kinase-like protein [Trametes cingulata]|nr:kinase-like protein [Trametes cingulata]